MIIVTSDLRCSRPLCSSQHTIGTTLPQRQRVSFMQPTRRTSTDHSARLNPHHQQEHSTCPHPWQEAWSLRTQQRAPAEPPTPTPSNQQAGVLRPERTLRLHCQCSTHELPATTFGLLGAWTPPHPPTEGRDDARCSLERR